MYINLWHDYIDLYGNGTRVAHVKLKFQEMKSIKLFSIAFILGLFINATPGYPAFTDQERDTREQERDQERQTQQGQEGQGQEFDPETQDREEIFGIDGLPQTVREALMDEYGDWVPVEASIKTDEEEGTFYQVLLTRGDDKSEAKIVSVTREGEVIDEQEVDLEELEEEKQKELEPRREF
jgi:hypothetical protein